MKYVPHHPKDVYVPKRGRVLRWRATGTKVKQVPHNFAHSQQEGHFRQLQDDAENAAWRWLTS